MIKPVSKMFKHKLDHVFILCVHGMDLEEASLLAVELYNNFYSQLRLIRTRIIRIFV